MEIIELDVWGRKAKDRIESFSYQSRADELYSALLAQRCIALGEDDGVKMSRDEMMLGAKTFLDHLGFPVEEEEE